MKKTGNKWRTAKCGRCGEKHTGYSGKLDSEDVEYVVCGSTHKRMNVQQHTITDVAFNTKWIKDCQDLFDYKPVDCFQLQHLPTDVTCYTIRIEECDRNKVKLGEHFKIDGELYEVVKFEWFYKMSDLQGDHVTLGVRPIKVVR